MIKKKKAVKPKKKPAKPKKKKTAVKSLKIKKAAAKTKKTKKPAKPKSKKSAALKKKVVDVMELPWRLPLEGEEFIGIVDDYFQHVGVIAFFLKRPLKLGDRIHVRGFATDFTQIVSSIQIDRNSVEKAQAGAGVGVKVDNRAHKGNYVYKIVQE